MRRPTSGLALSLVVTLAAGAHGQGTLSRATRACLDSIPASALQHHVAYLTTTYADSLDPEHRATAVSIDVLAQQLADQSRAILGGAAGVLPLAEPGITWRDVERNVHVVAMKSGAVRWRVSDDTTNHVTGGRAGAALLLAALDSLRAHDDALVLLDSAVTDSISFDIGFHLTPFGEPVDPTRAHMRLGFPIFDVMSPIERAPRAVGRGGLHFPEEWRRLGYQARVIARFTIDADGRVDPATIRDLPPRGSARQTGQDARAYQAFVTEVRRAIPDVHFEPARLGGCAIPREVQQPFDFLLRR